MLLEIDLDKATKEEKELVKKALNSYKSLLADEFDLLWNIFCENKDEFKDKKDKIISLTSEVYQMIDIDTIYLPTHMISTTEEINEANYNIADEILNDLENEITPNYTKDHYAVISISLNFYKNLHLGCFDTIYKTKQFMPYIEKDTEEKIFELRQIIMPHLNEKRYSNIEKGLDLGCKNAPIESIQIDSILKKIKVKEN